MKNVVTKPCVLHFSKKIKSCCVKMFIRFLKVKYTCIYSNHFINKCILQLLDNSVPAGRVAALFAESIQGVNGAVQFPKGYVKKARQLIKKYGGLYVADEVKVTWRSPLLLYFLYFNKKISIFIFPIILNPFKIIKFVLLFLGTNRFWSYR